MNYHFGVLERILVKLREYFGEKSSSFKEFLILFSCFSLIYAHLMQISSTSQISFSFSFPISFLSTVINAFPPSDTFLIASSTSSTMDGDPTFHQKILPHSQVLSITFSFQSLKMQCTPIIYPFDGKFMQSPSRIVFMLQELGSVFMCSIFRIFLREGLKLSFIKFYKLNQVFQGITPSSPGIIRQSNIKYCRAKLHSSNQLRTNSQQILFSQLSVQKAIPVSQMSTQKRNTQKLSVQKPGHIPSIRPDQLNRLSNQQRLRQVYKSTQIKQKEKSKAKNGRRFYLPIPDKKLIMNDQDNEPKTTGRYQSYLQGEQTDKHYQQLSHRYQPGHKNSKRYAPNDPKNDLSTNIQPNSAFRRKLPNQILNQIDTSQRKSSSKNIQQQITELNQNLTNRNSKKITKFDNPDITSRYRASSNYEQNPYHNEMFKIRRSAKKSLSGSLSKKPSENSIRQDVKIQNSLAKNVGTKSQLSSPKNDLLQQGKQHFKSGDFKSALQCFQKGQQLQQKNMNYKYNIALVYLKQHNYEQGLKILEQIIAQQPQFKKTIYLFAVISSKHLHNLQKAIDYADKGIQIYKNFTDLIFYRGKLHKELNNTDLAIEDMQKVVSLQKDHVQALYYLTFLYFEKQLMTHAMSSLSSAIYYDQDKNSQWRTEAFKLRAKLYMMDGKIKQAKKDLLKVKLQKNNKSNAEIYYLQGKLQILQNSTSEALINFEKCLREKDTISTQSSSIFTQNSPRQFLIPSLLQICKTKINVKDFYSAYHHISRARHFIPQINENDDSLVRFKHFIEGVVFLMKRKIDEGMRDFEKFIQVQSRIKQRVSQLKSRQSSPMQISAPARFLYSKQLQKQIQYFYPSFYLYRAFGYFMQNKHQSAIKDYQQYQKSQPLDKYTLYNLFLARGITLIKKEQFDSAIDYFNKAEQLFFKSETKKIQPYIYRAMTSIQMARVYHGGGQVIMKETPNIKTSKTINKNIKINIVKQQDSEIKILQLVFQALKQLDKAYDLNDGNSNLLFIRSLIYAYLNKFQQSLDDIIKAISKSQENVPKYFFFRGLLQSTLFNKKQAMNDFNISINLDGNNAPVYLQRSKLYFQSQNYTKALQDLARYGELRPQEDIEYHKAALYLVNGLYPMAEETAELIIDQNAVNFKEMKFNICLKMGKVQQAQEFVLQGKQTDKALLKIIRGDYDEFLTLINSQKDPHNLASRLGFFNVIQYYHLLGIAYFNLGEYERALQQFTIAQKQCNLRDMQKNASSYTGNKKGTNEQSEQQNINLGEKDMNCIIYNIFLCHMKLNNIKKAYQVFIKQIMPLNEKLQKSQFMINFSHLLFQAMKRSSSPKKSLNQSINHPLAQSTQDKEQAHVQLFSNMFTDVFGNEILIETSTFLLRTKLCYLNIDCDRLKQEYTARLWPEYVMTWLNVKEIENRPEPPWVKRQQSDQGLVFTDEVQNINIEFQTTQHDEEQDSEEQQEQEESQAEQQENDEQCEYDDQQEEYSRENNEDSSEVNKRFDPRKFRDQMKLDDSIERKLNKIVNRNKSPDF